MSTQSTQDAGNPFPPPTGLTQSFMLPPPPMPPAATAAWAPFPAAVKRPGNGLAIAGMILGITSVVFCWWGLLSLAQVVLAIVFGGVGLSRANRGAPHKGMAVAGLVCGLIGAVFYLMLGIFSLGVGLLI